MGQRIEFMRPWSEQVYGIPPEQVIGSSIKTKYEVRDGMPVLVRLPEVNFIDDKDGKPIGIQQQLVDAQSWPSAIQMSRRQIRRNQTINNRNGLCEVAARLIDGHLSKIVWAAQ